MNSETQIFSTRGLQGDVAHRAATDRNTGANPFSFRISARFLLHWSHNTWDQRLYVPSEGRSNGQLSCLRTQVSQYNTTQWVFYIAPFHLDHSALNEQ